MSLTHCKCVQGLHLSAQRRCFQGTGNNCLLIPQAIEERRVAQHKAASACQRLLIPESGPFPRCPGPSWTPASSYDHAGRSNLGSTSRCPRCSAKHPALTTSFHLHGPNAKREVTSCSPRWALSEQNFGIISVVPQPMLLKCLLPFLLPVKT